MINEGGMDFTGLGDLKRELELAWLNPDELDLTDLERPLAVNTVYDDNNPHLHMLNILRKPENFFLTCKLFFGIELHPFQQAILWELWHRKFPILIGSRGASKSFLLALYAVLRATFTQGARVVIVGAGFRQSKIIFEYIEKIIRDGHMFRNILGNATSESLIKRENDKHSCYIGKSIIIAIPIGDGSKIRGLRATHTLGDEIASIQPDIFEVVVGGFSIVNASPIEMVKATAKYKYLLKRGIIHEGEINPFDAGMGNQTVLSGTTTYQFNHFYGYWKKHREIILSGGDPKKLNEIFDGEIPENFDYRDFCIIRIPHRLLPDNYLDVKQVSKLKATISSVNFLHEYETVFSSDSNGFFKMSLIESCVTTQPISLPSGLVSFTATLYGDKKSRYVIGVDPASEQDNFSIIVLELHSDHTRIIHGWSTTRQKFNERKTTGTVKEDDFYGYCARKIRNLMKVFPTVRIGCDSQGGGRAIAEALHDSAKLEDGEVPIWEVVDKAKPKDSDGKSGDHVLELVNFANQEWTSTANHGLRKDMEDKVFLFPFVDSISLGIAFEEDNIHDRRYDTLEDVVWEIEELKEELSTIVVTQTATGRDRWDTPEIKLPNSRKGRQRKDRYSALVIANMIARSIHRTDAPAPYNCMGKFASQARGNVTGQMYVGPEEFMRKIGEFGDNFGTSIRRN